MAYRTSVEPGGLVNALHLVACSRLTLSGLMACRDLLILDIRLMLYTK